MRSSVRELTVRRLLCGLLLNPTSYRLHSATETQRFARISAGGNSATELLFRSLFLKCHPRKKDGYHRGGTGFGGALPPRNTGFSQTRNSCRHRAQGSQRSSGKQEDCIFKSLARCKSMRLTGVATVARLIISISE